MLPTIAYINFISTSVDSCHIGNHNTSPNLRLILLKKQKKGIIVKYIFLNSSAYINKKY